MVAFEVSPKPYPTFYRTYVKVSLQASLEAQGLVDLLVDEELEQIDEQRAISLAEELAEFEPYPEDEQDAITMASYALKPTRHVASELDAYAQHKTRVFAHNRQTTAVQGITADADKGGALRFLGWWSTAHQINVISLHDLRRLQPQHIEEYCNFLVDDREIKYGSVANYLNGIINLLSYLEANPQQDQGSSEAIDRVDGRRACQYCRNAGYDVILEGSCDCSPSPHPHPHPHPRCM